LSSRRSKVNRDGKKLSTINKLEQLDDYLSGYIEALEGLIENGEDVDTVKATKTIESLLDAQSVVQLTLHMVSTASEKKQRYANYVKFTMDKNHWANFKKNLAFTLAEELGLDIDTFSKLNVVEQNSLKARQNRILDAYIEVLSDEKSYIEMTTPNGMDNTVAARDLAESFYNPMSNTVNFASPTTQDLFRQRALWGKTLKGQSVNRDGTISIAQIVGLNINNSPITYLGIIPFEHYNDLVKKSFAKKVVHRPHRFSQVEAVSNYHCLILTGYDYQIEHSMNWMRNCIVWSMYCK